MNNDSKFSFVKSKTFLNFIKYGLVGVLGTIVHTAILTLCVEFLNINPKYSTVLGFIGSLILSFKLNSIWTFKGTKNSFFKYAAVCSVGLLLNVFIMILFVDILRYSYLIGQGVAIILIPIFNFTLSRYWVFSATNRKTG
ncbi:GtrA family protein [Paenibacillus sanguinis]|uniref:GtrA family protein n=1 Tax=Paenibacillus sanguinis TaxID=225906 RepID=UPI0003686CD9